MELGLTGKRALILGASRGLGFATARALVGEGASVILCGRNVEGLQKAAGDLRLGEGEVETSAFDLSSLEQMEQAIRQLTASGRPIDILVNNGGGPRPGAIADVPVDQWESAFAGMLRGIFFITAALLPDMRRRGWGRIINIVSSGVVQPIPNLGVSNTLRAALVGWAKTLATEVAAEGVTVNNVAPGRIHTERVDELDAAAAQRSGKPIKQIVEESLKTIPVARYGNPREFADVVAFLASENASYITGSLIRVDGGLIRSV